jgi:hypothetical protein
VADSDNDSGSTESINGFVSDEPASEDSIGFDSYTSALAAFLLSEKTRPPHWSLAKPQQSVGWWQQAVLGGLVAAYGSFERLRSVVVAVAAVSRRDIPSVHGG